MFITKWIDVSVEKRNQKKIRSILGDHISHGEVARVYSGDFYVLNNRSMVDIKCDVCGKEHTRRLCELVKKQPDPTIQKCDVCVYAIAREKAIQTQRTSEYRSKISTLTKEFYKTDRGMMTKKITSEKRKLWHKTPEGIASNKKNGARLPKFSKEAHPNWNPNKSAYTKYKSLVYSETMKHDLSVLEHYDKPRGLNGVDGAYQLDHVISMKHGFDNKISPEVIGHIDNLRFIPWEENRSKWHNSLHTK